MTTFEFESDLPRVLPADEEPVDFPAVIANPDRFVTAEELVLTQESLPPPGKSWAYDFHRREFVYGEGGRAPLTTNGLGTLAGWIEKCLMTERGAHPIHPPGYGLERGFGLGGAVSDIPFDLEERVRDALRFNPYITDIEDWAMTFDEDDEGWQVGFTVVLENGSTLSVTALRLAVS